MFKLGRMEYLVLREDWAGDPKRPFVCQRTDGKEFRFSEALVRARLKAERWSLR